MIDRKTVCDIILLDTSEFGGGKSSMDCVFCKIVNGDIPSLKVYEDEHTLVFMDIGRLIQDGDT